MKIENQHVVQLHYTVSEIGGAELESSRGREPLAILVGEGSLLPAIENALLGREAGDRLALSFEPEQAYGPRQAGLVQRIPRKHFKNQKLHPGMPVVVPTADGPRPVTVEKVGLSVVDVDLNHPLAGRSLHFEIEVIGVRAATADEKDHGHAHGEGGVQHP